MAVETAGFEAGDSAPSGCIEQVARACVRVRALSCVRVCVAVVVVVIVVVCVLCVCVYVCVHARVRVYEWVPVGDCVVAVCGVVWCGVAWYAYRASMMAGRGPRRGLTRDLCLPRKERR